MGDCEFLKTLSFWDKLSKEEKDYILNNCFFKKYSLKVFAAKIC